MSCAAEGLLESRKLCSELHLKKGFLPVCFLKGDAWKVTCLPALSINSSRPNTAQRPLNRQLIVMLFIPGGCVWRGGRWVVVWDLLPAWQWVHPRMAAGCELSTGTGPCGLQTTRALPLGLPAHAPLHHEHSVKRHAVARASLQCKSCKHATTACTSADFKSSAFR